MAHRGCDCCGGVELQEIYSYYYKVRTKKGQLAWEVRNVVCKKCGFAFVSPVPEEKTLSNFYENQYGYCRGQAIDYSIEKRISSIKKYKKTGSSLNKFIDIGAGLSAEMYLKKLTELFASIMVVEPNKDGEAKYYSIDQLQEGCGDVIVAYDVLHHITKPHDFLHKCANALTDSGFLILEVPNLYCYPQSPLFITYGEIVNHFSPRSLCSLASMSGLNLIELSSLKASRTERIFAVFSKEIGSGSIDVKSEPDKVEVNYASSCMREGVEQINFYKDKLLSARYEIDTISSENHTAIIWGANHACEMLLKDYKVPENTLIIDSNPQKKKLFWPQLVITPEKCLREIRHAKLFVLCAHVHIEDIKDWIKQNTGRSLKKEEILLI